MSDSPEDAFLEHRALIESIIDFTCRKRRLTGHHAEEFTARTWLRLVEADYAIFRKFQGRSSLKTYLTVVINRLALDYQTSLWGRWRPSKIARKAGPAAIRLETLFVRDGLPLGQALDIVERECGPIDRAALEKLAARFPLRTRRKEEHDEILEEAASRSPDPLDLLVRDEAATEFERINVRLNEILSGLDPRLRLVLKLRFGQDMKVSDIARSLGEDPKRLYRQIDDVLGRLREALESEGITQDALRKILQIFDKLD